MVLLIPMNTQPMTSLYYLGEPSYSFFLLHAVKVIFINILKLFCNQLIALLLLIMNLLANFKVIFNLHYAKISLNCNPYFLIFLLHNI